MYSQHNTIDDVAVNTLRRGSTLACLDVKYERSFTQRSLCFCQSGKDGMYAQKSFQTYETLCRKMAQCVHDFYSLKVKVFIRIPDT